MEFLGAFERKKNFVQNFLIFTLFSRHGIYVKIYTEYHYNMENI